jgi:hypothetical protein
MLDHLDSWVWTIGGTDESRPRELNGVEMSEPVVDRAELVLRPRTGWASSPDRTRPADPTLGPVSA